MFIVHAIKISKKKKKNPQKQRPPFPEVKESRCIHANVISILLLKSYNGAQFLWTHLLNICNTVKLTILAGIAENHGNKVVCKFRSVLKCFALHYPGIFWKHWNHFNRSSSANHRCSLTYIPKPNCGCSYITALIFLNTGVTPPSCQAALGMAATEGAVARFVSWSPKRHRWS